MSQVEASPAKWRVSDFVWVFVLGVLVIPTFIVALAAGLAGDEDISPWIQFAVGVPAIFVSIVLLADYVRRRRGYPEFSTAYGLSVNLGDLRYVALGIGLNIGLNILSTPLARLLAVEDNPQAVINTLLEILKQ